MGPILVHVMMELLVDIHKMITEYPDQCETTFSCYEKCDHGLPEIRSCIYSIFGLVINACFASHM